jgi:hypothetical protein
MTQKRKRLAGKASRCTTREIPLNAAHSNAPRELTLPASALSGERAGDGARVQS